VRDRFTPWRARRRGGVRPSCMVFVSSVPCCLVLHAFGACHFLGRVFVAANFPWHSFRITIMPGWTAPGPATSERYSITCFVLRCCRFVASLILRATCSIITEISLRI